MKRLLREPLVHFLLIGAALFLAFGLAGKPGGGAPGSIVVSKGQIASLVSGFTSTWQRPPTPEELEELIQDRVREEVYYREAMALGLDKDDATIRRRLRQKMEFFSDDSVPQTDPTDADLAAYMKAHPDSFRRTDGVVPELAAVRDRVAKEWGDARRLEANEAFYQGLLKKYRVKIERP